MTDSNSSTLPPQAERAGGKEKRGVFSPCSKSRAAGLDTSSRGIGAASKGELYSWNLVAEVLGLPPGPRLPEAGRGRARPLPAPPPHTHTGMGGHRGVGGGGT